jgi:hypothetical protein
VAAGVLERSRLWSRQKLARRLPRAESEDRGAHRGRLGASVWREAGRNADGSLIESE